MHVRGAMTMPLHLGQPRCQAIKPSKKARWVMTRRPGSYDTRKSIDLAASAEPICMRVLRLRKD